MNMTDVTRENVVSIIADLFDKQGANAYAGEAVTVSEHMLQGAALAAKSGADETIIAAALLHDIGHFTSEFGMYDEGDTLDKHHDEAGAAFLERFFPPLVTECVRLHVAAKRYLCATDPTYFDKLSAASVHTLQLQGGPMSDKEVAAFETNKWHKDAVRVRLWDEAGKDPEMVVPEFAAYTDLLERVVANAAAAA